MSKGVATLWVLGPWLVGESFFLFSRVGGGDPREDESREERPLSFVKGVTKAVFGYVQGEEWLPSHGAATFWGSFPSDGTRSLERNVCQLDVWERLWASSLSAEQTSLVYQTLPLRCRLTGH